MNKIIGGLQTVARCLAYAFFCALFCFAVEHGAIAQAIDQNNPVKIVGAFKNVKSDGEHAYGYSIELWKYRDGIVGLISAHRGLIGDPPTGILENVQFDSASKKLSFRAKVTLGLFSDRNHSNVPSRDILQFDGFLTDRKLKGKLVITNELCADKCPETKELSLRFWKNGTSRMSDYSSFKEWESLTKEILKRRGFDW